jgi:hypothetical protein
MRKTRRILVFISLSLGIMAGVSGCGNTELTLASNKVEFVAGREEKKTITVSAGTAEQVDSKDDVKGLSASVEGAFIKLATTSQVKPGTYEFTVLGNKGKSKATFTVTVSAASDAQTQSTGEPLVLDSTTVPLRSGTRRIVKVLKGTFQSCDPKLPFISVASDGKNNLTFAADNSAPMGVYKLAVKGQTGPDVELTVWVPPQPSSRAFALTMKHGTVEFTEGKEETRLVPVAFGWATNARIQSPMPVPGLKASVEHEPIHVVTACQGFGYKKDDLLTVDGKAKLKVTSVDGNGAIKAVIVVSSGSYLPSQRSIDLPASGGSGMDALFDLTNNVKIVAGDKLKAGKYEVFVNGPGGTTCSFWVDVAPPKASEAPRPWLTERGI